MAGLPSRGTIIVGDGGSGKAGLVDGKDEDEMGEKRIRERVMRLWFHVSRGRTRLYAHVEPLIMMRVSGPRLP